MMLHTSLLLDIPAETLEKYYSGLINKIFKILPLAEESKDNAKVYLDSLHVELQGCNELLPLIQDDPRYLSILSIIAWLRNHVMDCECTVRDVRREVFSAISMCKKLEAESYIGGGCDE